MPATSTSAYFHAADRLLVTREWAATQGWAGRVGGWIYDRLGRVICQGWFNVWQRYRRTILDWLTQRLTAFVTFIDMLSTTGTYRPTIMERDRRYRLLADAYDQAQAEARDPRRAYRGGKRLPV